MRRALWLLPPLLIAAGAEAAQRPYCGLRGQLRTAVASFGVYTHDSPIRLPFPRLQITNAVAGDIVSFKPKGLLSRKRTFEFVRFEGRRDVIGFENGKTVRIPLGDFYSEINGAFGDWVTLERRAMIATPVEFRELKVGDTVQFLDNYSLRPNDGELVAGKILEIKYDLDGLPSIQLENANGFKSYHFSRWMNPESLERLTFTPP